jgi:tetratricopeptide (TPR) repeat protein
MPSQPILCPQCGSQEVDYVPRRGGYLCVNNHFFSPPPPRTASLRIFLSYGRDDKAFVAQEVKKRLEALGHEVWYDLERLQCGQDWEEYLDHGLARAAEAGAAGRFVLLMTPHSVRRPDGFCLNELSRALQLNIGVYPVMVETCEPPLSICRIQWLDLRSGYSDQGITGKFDDLLRQLAAALQSGQRDFEGSLSQLGRILSPLSFEVDASFHLRRFTGRAWIVEKIDCWLEDEVGDKIFWITGGPGTGKTALASYLQYYHPAIKSFFLCKAPSSPRPEGRYEPGDPRWCVRTLAYQLSAMVPEYRSRLLHRADLEKIVSECSAEDMFEKLITETLYGVQIPPEGSAQRAVALIDGLDEVTVGSSNPLSSFLTRNAPRTPPWLRFLILSRGEEPLTGDFQRYVPLELDGERTLYENDLRSFIHKEFAPFAPGRAVPEATVEQIVTHSEGNFLYVEQLREALQRGIMSLTEAHGFPRGLGEMFHQWLKRKFPQLHEFRERFFSIVSVLCVAGSALSQEEAEILFGWTSGYEHHEFRERFGALFVYRNEQIAPFHKSLVDWFASERAGGFQVSLEHGHTLLAEKGYAAFRKAGAPLNAAERRCLHDLPMHLLARRRDRTTAMERLLEFLTDPAMFLECFREDIQGYISYWNKMSRALPEEHLLLRDSISRLEKSLAAGDGSAARNWQTHHTLGRLCFEIAEHRDAARLYEKAAALLPPECDLAVKAALLNDLGEAYCHDSSVRDLKRAEQCYGQALEIRRGIFPESDPELAGSINDMGHVYFYQDDFQNAMKHYSEALAMYRRLSGGPSYGEADSLNNLAVCLHAMGRNDEAEGYYREAVGILRRLTRSRWGVLVIYANFGRFLRETNRQEEALTQFRIAHDIALNLYGPESKRTMESANNLAGVYFETGRVAEGLGIFRELMQAYDRTYGQDDSGTIHQICLMIENLVTVGKEKEVQEYAREVLRRLNAYAIADPEVRAQALHDLGAVFFISHDYPNAMKYLREAYELRKTLYPAGHEYLWRTLYVLLETARAQKDEGLAIQVLDEFVRDQAPQARLAAVAVDAMEQYARSLRQAQRWQEAEAVYRKIIARCEPLYEQPDANASDQAACRFHYAVAYNEIAHYRYMPAGEYHEAEKYYAKGVAIVEACGNPGELRNMQLNHSIASYRCLDPNPECQEQRNALLEKIRTLTEEMERAGDARAVKGHNLLDRKEGKPVVQ